MAPRRGQSYSTRQKVKAKFVWFCSPVLRNHDIAISSSVTCFFLSFYIFFILMCLTAKRGHTIKKKLSIILGISSLCNGEVWCKTSFIRRELKMTPVIS